LRNSDFGFERSAYLRSAIPTNPQFVIRNPKFLWSGWTELNCHHEFPGLGCLRYTTPRKGRVESPTSNVQSLFSDPDFGPWTLDFWTGF